MLRRQSSILLICLLILSLLLPFCSPNKRPRKYKPNEEQPAESELMPMPRADPTYMQYLERNSMLTKSSEMARVVSGSELAWRSPASTGAPDELLSFADIWLAVHPLTILTSSRSSTFSQLNDPTLWPILREAGIKGLYVAPSQGGGSIWAKNRTGVDTGEDVVQYAFSQAAGREEEYRTLMSKVMDNQGLIGSDLIPAATGLGPDFFLAARNVREYPGVYCMVDIPQKLWSHLPEVASEWDTLPLDQNQINALNSEGLLPKAMRDESSPLGRAGGWAATGLVRGVDGHSRRWVYRYYGSPKCAVLNWEDPSQTAHRILSGSAVQQVGLRGQALIGLRFEAFQGLEAAPSNPSGARSFSVEPAMTAAQSMGREIRRYGGWTWVRDDDLPLNSVVDFLRSGTDFIFDSAFSPAAEHALLTGDATLARFMADEVLRLKIDARRLVHTMPSQDGINYSLPYLRFLETTAVGKDANTFRQSILNARDDAISHLSPSPVKDGYLYTTSTGLAAMALNMPKGNTTGYASEAAKGHSLLVFFKAMQPGIFMLSGQDLAGVMPLHWSSMSGSSSSWDVANASRGSYALTSSAERLAVTTMGMPKAQLLYPAPDEQVHKKGSFLRRIGGFLRARSQIGVARGTLVARPATKNTGVIALLTRMPDKNGYLLSVCNFSRNSVRENVSLAGVPGIASELGQVQAISLGGSHTVSRQHISVSLGPWEGRALLIGKVAGSTGPVSPETVTAVNPIAPTPPDEVFDKMQQAALAQGQEVNITSELARQDPNITQGLPPRRSYAPSAGDTAVVQHGGEAAQKIIPLARISEDTVGRARQRTLRPGQPTELVTRLPAFGGRAATAATATAAPARSRAKVKKAAAEQARESVEPMVQAPAPTQQPVAQPESVPTPQPTAAREWPQQASPGGNLYGAPIQTEGPSRTADSESGPATSSLPVRRPTVSTTAQSSRRSLSYRPMPSAPSLPATNPRQTPGSEPSQVSSEPLHE